MVGVALAESAGHWRFRPHTMATRTMDMDYRVMLGLCAARHILDPCEQVSIFKPLGAQPVRDKDTFPEFGLGCVFPQII